MAESVTLYSFADSDRSGKVRWLAAELGIEVVEERVAFGSHQGPPYQTVNPMCRVPAVRFRGEVLTESTAICHHLAESFTSPKLWIGPGEPGRWDYLFWLAAFGETLEARLVEIAISGAGMVPPAYAELHTPSARQSLAVLAGKLPAEGFLAGDRFTLADLLAGYGLRLGVQTGLVEREAVEPYLGRLVVRPAAQKARVFEGL